MNHIHDKNNDQHHDSDDFSTSEISNSSGHLTSTTGGEESREFEIYAKKESETVEVWRELAIGSIIIVATFVTSVIFWYSSNQDNENFRTTFSIVADTTRDSCALYDTTIQEAFAQLSVSFTIYAKLSESIWPTVTVPYFEVLGAHARSQSDVASIILVPVVPEHMKTTWEDYAEKSLEGWYNESLWLYQQEQEGNHNNASSYTTNNVTIASFNDNSQLQQKQQQQSHTTTASITGKTYSYYSKSEALRKIYRFDGGEAVPEVGPGPYGPIWQKSPPPPIPNLVNFDTLSTPIINELYRSMLECRCTLISRALSPTTINFLLQQGETMQQQSQNVEYNNTRANNETTVYSMILQPVYQDLDMPSTTPKIVGFLLMAFSWEDYLSHILAADEMDGMFAVIKNSCGQEFTFQVGSSEIQFLGYGDQHDIWFHTREVVVDILSMMNPGTKNDDSYVQTSSSNSFMNNNSNTTNKEDDEEYMNRNDNAFCSYRLYMYPSFQMRNQYRTQTNTIIITSVILLSFVLILVVFCVYEERVHRRNFKMVQAASRSNAIVSSLFPSNVRDRLFDNKENESRFSVQSGRKRKSFILRRNGSIRNSVTHAPQAPRSLLQTYLTDTSKRRSASNTRTNDIDSAHFYDEDPDIEATLRNKPIADLFPNTTVLFADIVGFTAWSSVREPSQVFMLLETLYRAFDGIAKRRRVFKVETIGDCYVAVAGLPKPIKDHAVVMARFARDCLHRMYYLSKRLEVTLGPDTGDLSMRFGLHSGPTTAGVLRGERSRFQLFGDTVNTAARIESTGRRGRIHLSQETADNICAAGKASWITLREDKVTAKGKGELTTYWLTVADSSGETESNYSASSHHSHSSSRDDGNNLYARKYHTPNTDELGYEDPNAAANATKMRGDGRGMDTAVSLPEGSESISNVDDSTHSEQGAVLLPQQQQQQEFMKHRRSNSGHHRSDGMVTDGTNVVNNVVDNHKNGNFVDHKTQKSKNKHEKQQRLIDWNVQILQRLLKQIVARRQAEENTNFNNVPLFSASTPADSAKERFRLPTGITVLEEVKEIITLPKFDARVAKNTQDPDFVELDQCVTDQLEHFVLTIATLYRDNPFHNFEHASHVTMSVVKLLSRIVAPAIDYFEGDTILEEENEKKLKKKLASKMHDHTYGITSDPLTQFAVVLSALIHDVDHTGVPNSQLVLENVSIASKYKNQSVAEQNSVDLSWRLLMNPRYADLCNVICATESEWERFRQLIVNSVMATDIIDKDLKALRNARWEKAFSADTDSVSSDNEENSSSKSLATMNNNSIVVVGCVLPIGSGLGKTPSRNQQPGHSDKINRKATIVIEHLLQASDVSHTMQHWHIFRKWNERLFFEMYAAYKAGRATKNPGDFWYQGEIGFFDFYIIPLAKKLKECGVFGVSHDEYLNYAIHNRDEWALRGKAIVGEMIASVQDAAKRSPPPKVRKIHRERRRLSLTSGCSY